MADVERHEEAVERTLPRRSDAGEEVLDATLLEAVEREQVLPSRVEAEDVGEVGDESALDEQLDGLLPEPLDVERAARREVRDRLEQPVRTVDVLAQVVRLALRADERLRAERAVGGHPPAPRSARALRDDGPDDLGDDVAGTADDDGVPHPDVLGVHLDLVVERRMGDRRPGDEHRFEHGERRDLPRPADVHLDGEQPRLLLDRRHLVGDRPPGSPRGPAEACLLREVVDLDDDAVRLVGEAVALLRRALDLRPDRIDALDGDRLRRDRESRLREPTQRLAVRGDRQPVDRTQAVDPERERSCRGHARVLLPQRTGGGVARVHERGLAGLDPGRVHAAERVERQMHLPPDLEQRGGRGHVQPVRHVRDGEDLRGDVLPGGAITTGGGDGEHTVPVDEVDRDAVDLALAHVADGHRVVTEAAADARGPRLDLLAVERVVERQHRHQMLDGRERGVDGRADLTGRRSVAGEVGMARLEVLELSQFGVERRVRHRRFGQHVVAVAGLADGACELIVATTGRLRLATRAHRSPTRARTGSRAGRSAAVMRPPPRQTRSAGS